MTSSTFLQLFIVAVCAIYAVSAAVTAKLPPDFDTCHLKDPKFDKCVERAIEKALKILAKGYAPLGIFPFDPLQITTIDIAQGSGPVSINLKFRDLLIKGLKDAKVSNFKSNMDSLKFTAKVNMKKVELDGKYNINGKILVLPINGDGRSQLSLDDCDADVVITGTRVNKNGEVYMKVTDFGFDLDTKKLAIKLENLFNGDKALGDNMNVFLNENWSDIFKELKPSIQKAFGLAFAEISNRIFTKVPFNDVFES